MILTNKLLHYIFRITIFIKGLNGIFEISGSMILFFINSKPILALMSFIFYNDLAYDPTDIMASAVVFFLGEMSRSTRLFSATVLLIFGLINLSLVFALWKEKFWIYPSVGVVLMLLIAYQIFRFSHTGSKILFLLTLVDIMIVFFIFREYIHHTKIKTKKSA